MLIANGLLGAFGDFNPPPTLRLVLKGEERRLNELGFFEVSVEDGFGIGLGAVGMGGFKIGAATEVVEGAAVDREEPMDEEDVKVAVDEADDNGGSGIDEPLDPRGEEDGSSWLRKV